MKLRGIGSGDSSSELFRIARENSVAGHHACMLDGAIVALLIRHGRGVVGIAAPPESHTSLKYGAIRLEFQGWFRTAPPDTEPCFVDDGGILPSHAEIDFLIDAGMSVEQCPGAAATEARIALVSPLTERNLGLDCAVDDEGSLTGMAGNIKPTSGEINTQRGILGCADPLYQL